MLDFISQFHMPLAWKQRPAWHNGVLTGYCTRLHVLLELWTLYVNSKPLTSFGFCPKAKYLADKCAWSRKPWCICLHVARLRLKALICVMSTCVWTAVWVWEREALGDHLQNETFFSQALTVHSSPNHDRVNFKVLAFFCKVTCLRNIWNIAIVRLNTLDCENF